MNEAHDRISREDESAKVLRESEKRLRLFIAASSNMIYQINADWTKIEKLVGKELLADVPESITEWMDKYVLPEDQMHMLAAINHAIDNKSVVELEHRTKLADSSVGRVYFRAIPLLNELGEIKEWFGTATDITERRSTEDALRTSEENYHIQQEKNAKDHAAELLANKELLQTTIDSTPDTIQVFKTVRDKDNKIIDFVWIMNNKQGIIQNGDVIGQTLLAKNPGVIDTGIFDKMVETVETGIPVEHMQFYSYEQFDGWFYQALVKSGDGLVMTTRDITSQKKAEEEILQLTDEVAQKATDKYYSIFNSIDEGFCIYELIYDNEKAVDLRWVEVNPAYEKQTGLKDTVGKLASDVMPGTETYWLEIYDKVVKTGESIHFENWHEPTGRWYTTFASRLGRAPSKQVAVLFADVTERKMQEEQQKFLLRFSDVIRTIADPIQTQRAAMRLLGEELNATRAFYYTVVQEEGNWIYIVEGDWHADPNQPVFSGRFPIAAFGSNIFARLPLGETFVCSDTRKLDITADELQSYLNIQVISWVAYPIIRQGSYEGGVCLHCHVARDWTKHDVALIAGVAERTWEAMERSRAEVALQKSEERLQLSIKSGNFFTWEIDPQTSDAKYSKNSNEVLGFEVSKISGNNFIHIHPDDEAFVLTAVNKAITGEAVLDVEHRIIHPQTKEIIWLRAQGQLTNRSDSKTVFIGITQNITKWKQAEEALQKSEEKYRSEAARLNATLKSMNDAVYIGDFTGITLANQAALDQLGYGSYEELNKNIGILAKEIETRDAISQEVITAGQQAFARALRGEHVVQNVQVRNVKSGEERIVRSAAAPVIVDEKIVAAVAINTDVTNQWKLAAALRENEERQSFLLKLSDVLRPLTDTHQIQNAAMKLLAQHFEVMRATYFQVQADQDTFQLMAQYEQDAPPMPNEMHLSDFSPDLADDCRSGRTLMVVETENEARSDVYQAIGVRAWLAVPLVKHGLLVAVLGVQSKIPRNWTDTEVQLLEDVAQRTWAAVERASSENALRESESQLKQLLKMRDEFISIASHELKTPITSMKVYAQIVQKRLDEIGDTDNRDLVSKLNVQINRLTALINSLLDTTKISEGQLQLNLEQFDINGLLSERIEEIRRTSNHKFELQLHDLLQVTADRERIGQVITNLLSNAIKYSSKGTTITVISTPAPDGVVVNIQDEGYGIPEKDIGRIFDKFVRVTANNMDTFPGMGLGLYITTQIIQKHHGTISVQSVEGKGSTFSFTLPYKHQKRL